MIHFTKDTLERSMRSYASAVLVTVCLAGPSNAAWVCKTEFMSATGKGVNGWSATETNARPVYLIRPVQSGDVIRDPNPSQRMVTHVLKLVGSDEFPPMAYFVDKPGEDTDYMTSEMGSVVAVFNKKTLKVVVSGMERYLSQDKSTVPSLISFGSCSEIE